MTEYPEAPGYRAEAGWVKGNPLNNAVYIERAVEVYPEWETVLRAADAYLESAVPGYNVLQIKAKFGELRFYWDSPEGVEVTPEVRQAVSDILAQAEILR